MQTMTRGINDTAGGDRQTQRSTFLCVERVSVSSLTFRLSRGRLKMTRVAVTLCVIWLLAAFCAASSGHPLLNDSVETIGPRVFLCLYEVRVSICGSGDLCL
jgi:hypothetical protein